MPELKLSVIVVKLLKLLQWNLRIGKQHGKLELKIENFKCKKCEKMLTMKEVEKFT